MKTEEQIIFRAVSIEHLLSDSRAALSGDQREKLEIELAALSWVLEGDCEKCK